MSLYSPFSNKDKECLFAQNYQEFYDIFWNAPIGIFKSTPEGFFVSANPALAQMYGFTAPERLITAITDIRNMLEANQSFASMLGYSLDEVYALHTWDWEAVMPGKDIRESFRDLSSIDMTFETRHQRKDGFAIDVEVSTTGAQIQSQNVVIAICRDISHRKLMERHLAHSHSLMRYIIEHANSAVAVHDKDYRYMYVSQSYLDQYQIQENNIIGKHHYEVFPDLPQKWRDSHERALYGEISRGEQDPFYRRDGRL